MTALTLLVVLTAVSAAQEKRPAAPGEQARAGDPEPLAVGRGLEAIDALRSDGLKTLNHYASSGANKTTEKNMAALKGGPLRFRGSVYERNYDQYSVALKRLHEALGKVIPAEPISPDVRTHFGNASLPEASIQARKRAWIAGRLKDYEQSWDEAALAVARMSWAMSTKDKAPIVDGEYARGWQQNRPEESVRQREAADLRKRLRAELDRRLSAYWDEAREAWLAPAPGK